MATAASSCFILLWLIRWPSTAAAYPVHLCRINRVIIGSSFFTVFAKESMHVYTYAELAHIMTKLFIHVFIIIKQRFELNRAAANDRKYHRQTKLTGTNNRFGCTADSDPYIQVII